MAPADEDESFDSAKLAVLKPCLIASCASNPNGLKPERADCDSFVNDMLSAGEEELD